jgi:biotin carboxyl carrier protein
MEDKMKVDRKRSAKPPRADAEPKQASVSKPQRTSKTKAASQQKSSAQPQSKQDRVLAMLRRKDGTTVAAVMKATGWQNHSVRGFFTGVVRRKLRLNLLSEKSDGERVYRIVDGKRVKAGRSNRKRAD